MSEGRNRKFYLLVREDVGLQNSRKLLLQILKLLIVVSNAFHVTLNRKPHLFISFKVLKGLVLKSELRENLERFRKSLNQKISKSFIWEMEEISRSLNQEQISVSYHFLKWMLYLLICYQISFLVNCHLLSIKFLAFTHRNFQAKRHWSGPVACRRPGGSNHCCIFILLLNNKTRVPTGKSKKCYFLVQRSYWHGTSSILPLGSVETLPRWRIHRQQ
jgi:hypothetical protein